MTALQLLPPRQRAVLILRDVLGFHAREVAQVLDSTEESVTSALKRARATLQRRLLRSGEREQPPAPGSAAERELVERFTRAFEAKDVRDPQAPVLHATGLLVLTLAGDRICAMTRFDTSMLAYLGLPRTLPDCCHEPSRTEETPELPDGQNLGSALGRTSAYDPFGEQITPARPGSCAGPRPVRAGAGARWCPRSR